MKKGIALNENIHINQLGYRPCDKKIVIVNGNSTAFEVIDEVSGNPVFTGTLTDGMKDESTGDFVSYGDFSTLKAPGKYFLKVDSFGNSFSFEINDNVYNATQDGLLKAMYFQRCGCVLEEKHAGVWKHDICHTEEGSLYWDANTKLDVSGGWHDAGDYGRYVVPAAKAVADMLLAYEFFPEAFKGEINIPESGNGIPDILNEVKYEVDWLFKMQDKNSGGVYTKVATPNFAGMIMPEDDKAPLIIYHMSSPAAGDFAAAMAMAARVYSNFDKSYSGKCLVAAEKAWQWLISNPQTLFTNPKDAGSGAYGDKTDIDEKYWAAAELYKTTGKEEYHDVFKSLLKKLEAPVELGWADVAGYGSIAYLFTEKSKVDTAVYEEVKSKYIAHANKLLQVSKKDGYKVTLTSAQYIWGSNMNILNHAMHLILSNMLSPNSEYVDAALAQWHYIYGANSLNFSFVSGYGSNAMMNPHHRPSDADGIVDPVPGLVSGGPCARLADVIAKEVLQGQPPARCFVDHTESYSTNEITIYWNSPAIFVAGYLNR
jgi:endoglucanase